MSRFAAFIALPLLSYLLAYVGTSALAQYDCGAPILDAEFTTDGSAIWLYHSDGLIERWNVATGTVQHRATIGSPGWIPDIAVSPDEQLAAIPNGEMIELWDLSGGFLQNVIYLDDYAHQVVFVSQDRLLVNHTLLFEPRPPYPSIPNEVPPHLWNGITLSQDGRVFFHARYNGSPIERWDGRELVRIFDTDYERVLALTLSPDGTRLGAVQTGVIRIWNVATGVVYAEFEIEVRDHTLDFFVTQDQRLVAVTQYPFTITVWDIETEDLVRSWKVDRAGQPTALSPDGSTLFLNSSPAVLWDLNTGLQTWVLCRPLLNPRWFASVIALAGGIVMWVVLSRRKLKEEALLSHRRWMINSAQLCCVVTLGLAVHLIATSGFFERLFSVQVLMIASLIWGFSAVGLALRTHLRVWRLLTDKGSGCLFPVFAALFIFWMMFFGCIFTTPPVP